ncbi:MAG: hypothetical protein R3F31_04860 [Verrucomicrobiales bacterium]
MSQNLFPFLSILVALIGSLTMIIVVLNLIQMNKGEGRVPEEIEMAKAYVELEKQIENDKAKADQLRQLIENLIQLRTETVQTKEKLKMLQNLLDSTTKLEAARDELVAKLNILTNTNKSWSRIKGYPCPDRTAQEGTRGQEIAGRCSGPQGHPKWFRLRDPTLFPRNRRQNRAHSQESHGSSGEHPFGFADAG